MLVPKCSGLTVPPDARFECGWIRLWPSRRRGCGIRRIIDSMRPQIRPQRTAKSAAHKAFRAPLIVESRTPYHIYCAYRARFLPKVEAGVVKDCTPGRFCLMGFDLWSGWPPSGINWLRERHLLPPRRED